MGHPQSSPGLAQWQRPNTLKSYFVWVVTHQVAFPVALKLLKLLHTDRGLIQL